MLRCPGTQIQNQISQVIGYTTGQLREIPKSSDVGNTTTFTIPNLGEGTTYLFTVAAYNTASLESQPSVEVSYTTGSDSDTTLLTVVNGTAGGNYPVGKQVLVNAKPPPEGSQFAAWTGDVPILANQSVPTTAATVPSSGVTITAIYSASD